ncbi:MAG: hypothetical protein QXF76_03135 [Candidatus Anstonellales archaeon]
MIALNNPNYLKYFLLVLTILIVSNSLQFSQTPPSFPTTFYGVITSVNENSTHPLNGQILKADLNGSISTTLIGDVTLYNCGSNTCKYYIVVSRNSGDTSTNVNFYINNNPINSYISSGSPTFSPGGVVRLDFSNVPASLFACLNNCTSQGQSQGSGTGTGTGGAPASYTSGSSGSGGGGGGGGGAGGSLTNETESEGKKDRKNETAKKDVTIEKKNIRDSSITEFVIYVREHEGNESSINVKINELGRKDLVVQETKIFDKYEIVVNGTKGNISRGRFKFSIPKEWYSINGLDPFTTKAFLYEDNRLVGKELIPLGSDDKYYYFELDLTNLKAKTEVSVGARSLSQIKLTCVTLGCPEGEECKLVNNEMKCVKKEIFQQEINLPGMPIKRDESILSIVIPILVVGLVAIGYLLYRNVIGNLSKQKNLKTK